MLSNYGRSRVRFLLAASGVWIATYVKESAPCDLCPPAKRLDTRTKVTGTMIGNGVEYRVCNKCLFKINKRREEGYGPLVRELYLPQTVRRERAAKRREQQQTETSVPSE